MGKFPNIKKDKHLRTFVGKALLNWFFCVVLLASSPLFLKITFELVSKTKWTIIANKYYSECIIAACALASCIYAIDIDNTSKTVFRTAIKHISLASIVFCICLYFAFYYELSPEQQIPDSWADGEQYTYTIISVVIYIWHIFAGLFITFTDSKNTYLFHAFLKLARIRISGNITNNNISEESR